MTSRLRGQLRKFHCINSNLHPGSRQRGFTLVEVMLTTVLIAIVTALALPSYSSMVEKRLLLKNVEQIAAFLNSVQSVSMLTNQVITVSYSRSNHRNWCFGAVIDTTDCDCNQTAPSANDFCAIEGQRFVLDNTDTNDVRLMHSMQGDGAYSFDPTRGLLQDLNDSLKIHLHADSGDFDLKVKVSNTGHVTVCSKSQNESIPGYKVCV